MTIQSLRGYFYQRTGCLLFEDILAIDKVQHHPTYRLVTVPLPGPLKDET